MDGHRFDDLTRRLATGTSRRRVLRLGGGGLVAGLLTLAGGGRAAADDTPKPLGKKCRKDAQCVTGYCDPDIKICAVRSISQAGELTTDDFTFTPCNAPAGLLFAYDAYTFEHGGGPLPISVLSTFSGGGSLVQPYLYLYTSFDPADPCANLVAQDTGGCGFDAYLEFADLPLGEYTIVVSSEFIVSHAFGTGSYTLQLYMPRVC